MQLQLLPIQNRLQKCLFHVYASQLSVVCIIILFIQNKDSWWKIVQLFLRWLRIVLNLNSQEGDQNIPFEFAFYAHIHILFPKFEHRDLWLSTCEISFLFFFWVSFHFLVLPWESDDNWNAIIETVYIVLFCFVFFLHWNTSIIVNCLTFNGITALDAAVLFRISMSKTCNRQIYQFEYSLCACVRVLAWSTLNNSEFTLNKITVWWPCTKFCSKIALSSMTLRASSGYGHSITIAHTHTHKPQFTQRKIQQHVCQVTFLWRIQDSIPNFNCLMFCWITQFTLGKYRNVT